MATVKLQNGKVILKDEKVSCSCCGVPECCPYPAKGIQDGLIFPSDLPDEITFNSATYSLSGSQYGNTTNGVIYEGGVWAKYTEGNRSTQPCLLQGNVADTLPDVLNASVVDGGGNPVVPSYQLTRISLCVWQGSGATLQYQSLIYPFGLRDSWLWTGTGVISAVATGSPRRLKTPIGNYNTAIPGVTGIISE